MIMSTELDEYKDRILNAVTDAIFCASLTTASDGTRVATLMSGEILDALLTIQTAVVATSPHVSSPTKLRKFADEFSKTFYKRTVAAQKNADLQEVFKNRFTMPEVVS
jgi:hypothetical protein